MTRILGVLGLAGRRSTGRSIASQSRRPGTADNLIDVANLQGRYGIITLGAALVIITGGIDLSIGSVVGCSAVLFGVLMERRASTRTLAVPLVVAVRRDSSGSANGLLITRLKLQPFLVTLCGMFVYRGVARLLGGLARNRQPHPSARGASGVRRAAPTRSATSWSGRTRRASSIFPAQFVLLLVLAAVVGFFLHRTAYGRYWYAIGHNELAAKYAGVNVEPAARRGLRHLLGARGAGGRAALPRHADRFSPTAAASGLELYAILGAVLGGCSLRGGEGTAVGMVLGAMVLPVLENLVSFRGLKSDVIPAVIGLTLLVRHDRGRIDSPAVASSRR